MSARVPYIAGLLPGAKGRSPQLRPRRRLFETDLPPVLAPDSDAGHARDARTLTAPPLDVASIRASAPPAAPQAPSPASAIDRPPSSPNLTPQPAEPAAFPIADPSARTARPAMDPQPSAPSVPGRPPALEAHPRDAPAPNSQSATHLARQPVGAHERAVSAAPSAPAAREPAPEHPALLTPRVAADRAGGRGSLGDALEAPREGRAPARAQGAPGRGDALSHPAQPSRPAVSATHDAPAHPPEPGRDHAASAQRRQAPEALPPLDTERRALAAASLLPAPLPGQRQRRAAPPRVSIGTIEVTVTPPPPPPPPPAPASMSNPPGVPAALAPAAAGPATPRPVREQLRLGERRWYGMAQA
jgi:hypothetical protein